MKNNGLITASIVVYSSFSFFFFYNGLMILRMPLEIALVCLVATSTNGVLRKLKIENYTVK